METTLKPIVQAEASPKELMEKKRLRESCREFESVMVSYLLKTMRSSVMTADEPENASEMYQEMLDGQISKEVSNTGSMGLGDMLYNRLSTLMKTEPGTAKGQASISNALAENLALKGKNFPIK